MSRRIYLKADKETSAKIIALMIERDEMFARAQRMSRRMGGSRSSVYSSHFGGTCFVSGFIFSDESKVDKKMFRRLKKVSDGWAVRKSRKKSKERTEFESLRSNAVGDIMKLVGMPAFSGLKMPSPGVHIVGSTVYLSVTPETKGHGCERISDLEYEAAVGEND